MSDTEIPAAFQTEEQAPEEQPKPRRGRPKGSKNKPKVPGGGHVDSSALIPDLESYSDGVVREQRYWVGIFADAPIDNISIAGIAFSKATSVFEKVSGKRDKQSIPLVGGIANLSKRGFDELCHRLPRTVVRVTKGKIDPETGLEMSNDRRGKPIRIPSAEDIEMRKKMGRPLHPYVRRDGDEPAAKFLFCVPCDGTRHGVGQPYPPSIAEAGLEWPEE